MVRQYSALILTIVSFLLWGLLGHCLHSKYQHPAQGFMHHQLNATSIPVQCLWKFKRSGVRVVPSPNGEVNGCLDNHLLHHHLHQLNREEEELPQETYPVFARYNASSLSLGWDYLEVGSVLTKTMSSSSSPLNSPQQIANKDDINPSVEVWRQMGILEGYLTSLSIAQFIPVSLPESALTPAEKKWIEDEHLPWVRAKVKENEEESSSSQQYWGQIGKLLAQMEGIAEGFNLAAASSSDATGTNVSFLDIYLQNYRDDFGDIVKAIEVQNKERQGQPPVGKDNSRRYQSGIHCSAFIKPTDDDLFVSHDTWSGYVKLANRIYKKYTLGFVVESGSGSDNSSGGRGGFAQGRQIVFSSLPSLVSSQDDWYQIVDLSTGTELSTLETTNFVFNMSLYNSVHPQTVSETMRVMTANWLATGGAEWTEIFSRYNSGTYNNQWMVVDFTKYAPPSLSLERNDRTTKNNNNNGSSSKKSKIKIQENTLWIAEQIPSLIERADVSSVLQEQGYWASYNTPYFPTIYNISGYTLMEREQGTFWSYTKYARPEIFKRNSSLVTDLLSMMALMRYNNFLHDPLSLIPNCSSAREGRCTPPSSAWLAVAARGDLNPGWNFTKQENLYAYGVLYPMVGFSCFGAVDSKISSWSHRSDLRSWVINGPTNTQQPTFEWEKSHCSKPPGAAETFDFPWVEILNPL